MILLFQELRSRRDKVIEELKGLQESVADILELINNDEVMKKMTSMRDSRALNNYLTQELDVRNFDDKNWFFIQTYENNFVIFSNTKLHFSYFSSKLR